MNCGDDIAYIALCIELGCQILLNHVTARPQQGADLCPGGHHAGCLAVHHRR